MDELKFELPAETGSRLQDEDIKCFLDPIYSTVAFQNPMYTLQSGLILDPHHLSFCFLRYPQVKHQAKHLNFGRQHVILAKIPGQHLTWMVLSLGQSLQGVPGWDD